MIVKYEYKTLKWEPTGWFFGGKIDEVAINDELNRYGALGWELVNIFSVNQNQGASRFVVAVMKKERH